MKTCYFTSITANYLAKARVLCKTLKKYNANATFILGISDDIPDFVDITKEPFDDIIEAKNLKAIENKNSFFFKHTITELCTAVKPFMAQEIMKKYNSNVIYLDPDIAVFNSLKELEAMFESSSILLTPHQYIPEKEDIYIRENEILFLKRGTFNFGFFGVKNDEEGQRFLNWWAERLKNYCFDDNLEVLKELSQDGLLGLFTDQKWADLIPCFFNNFKIIKEPGYNVCTWNLSARHVVKKDKDVFTVNDKPLYFFHFSGYDSGGHRNELMKSLDYYPHNKDVMLLSKWYEEQLKINEQDVFGKIKIKSKYSNGEEIKNLERKIYHIRKDIYHIFPNPYEVTDGHCYYKWVREEYKHYFTKEKEIERNETIFMKIINMILPLGSRRRYYIRKLFKLWFKR